VSTDNGSIDLGFEGKTALVTGASSGFGRGIATKLAGGGARVVAVGRDDERLAETAAAIEASGGTCLAVTEDLVAEGAAERVAEAAVSAFGPIATLINNAGIFAYAPLAETDRAQIDEMVAINFRAPLELTKAVVPHMSRGSSVVFVGSNLAHHGVPGMALYSATKGAVEVLAKVLAIELGPEGIRVNAVSPGPSRTPMTSAITSDPETEKMVVDGTPVGRMGEVEDIAAAVCYLASEQAAGYVAGATLVIDGGQVAS
jgi:NAD(P)-dependent dehydrogenase (short-subunit alcohol dehydrogenase family)